MDEEEYQRLNTCSTLREHAFHSAIPVVGPLIARFRAAWNSVSTKWYVRPLIQQQSEFNMLVVQHLGETDVHLDETNARLVEVDREQVALRRDVAELTQQVVQMNRLLTTLNEHLAELEGK